MNINRDYLIINDVKKSNVKLDNGSMFFYITDKNTQNIFVNLVINVSNNDLIQKYANIENAEDYALTMNIVKPSNTPKIIEGKLHDKEKAIFEFDLNEDCCDEIGTYRCELLTKCTINGHEEITTSNKLTYKVKSSVLNDLDDIVEAPEYPLVIQLFDKLSDIEQYEEDRRTNELARQLAEEQRQARFNTLDADMVDRVTAMDDKMVDVENRVSTKEQAVDKLIVDTKADIDEYKVAKDQEIDDYKTAKDTEINNAIAAQDNKIDTAISNQNDRIAVAENNDVAQNNRLDTLENRATQHESRLTDVEAKNAEQDGRLDIVENKNQQQDNRLDVVEAKNVEQDNRLNEIEAIDVAQNNRLDAIEVKNQEQDDRLLDIEKVNKRQDIDLKCLFTEAKNNMMDITEEGNSVYLQNSTEGHVFIDEIKGNTLVNCNKEPNKELILNGNINTSGDNTVTLTEGVDGGLVDVALEGNTLVNVSKTKDSTAITKAYTVENSGNHIALQGDVDGNCRPVITGNTLVNLYDTSRVVVSQQCYIENNTIKLTTTSNKWSNFFNTNKDVIKPSTVYTIIFNITKNTLSPASLICFSSYAGDNDIFKDCFSDGNTGFLSIPGGTTGTLVYKRTSLSDLSSSTTLFRSFFDNVDNKENCEVEMSVILLEGDYTDKPIPDYFEGLQSTFEDNLVTQEMVDNGEEVTDNLGKYKVDYKVTGKNKFAIKEAPFINSGDTKLLSYSDNSLTANAISTSTWQYVKVPLYNLKPNTDYVLSCDVDNSSLYARVYNANTPIDVKHENDASKRRFNTSNYNDLSIRFFVTINPAVIGVVNYTNIQLEEGSVVTAYEPYKELIKTLYLNSPLLEGDTIEEKDGGVYHVHRYTKVVLDGVDNSGMSKEQNAEFNDDNTILKVSYTRDDIKSMATTTEYDGSLCDKLYWKADIPTKASDTPCYGRSSLDWKLMINIPLTNNTEEDINTYLQSNPLTFVLPLEIPQYELIEQSNLVIPSYANGHLDLASAVPVSKVNFLHFEEELTYLYPSTSYTVQFISDKAISIDIILGGTQLLALNIVKGLNRITITTPDTLADNKLVIDGVGAKISDVVVTDTNREFKYFEGMKSVGEGEELEVTSANSDNSSSNTQQLTHEPLRAVGGVKDRYILIDGKWYIERNCGYNDIENYSTINNEDVRGVIVTFNNCKRGPLVICDSIKVSRPYIPGTFYINPGNIVVVFDKNDPITDEDILEKVSQYNFVHQLATPAYEPIDYNPLEVYSDVTHISTNSTIPCNIIVKNHGFNCLLKPSTTYTISSNLGLNTVTTPSTLAEDCLRFMDTDTSDVTTMKNVLVLEGDWTSKANLIPNNFSGIESAFEQEYDEEKGKYKVNVKVANEDKSKENNITFYINEPLRGIGNVKDRLYVKDDKVVVQRNCYSVTFDGSDNEGWLLTSNPSANTTRFRINVVPTCYGSLSGYCDKFNILNNTNAIDKESISLGDSFTVRIFNNKLQTQDIAGFKQWLSENPTTVVYQLTEPTYEEVEYNDTKLFIESFKNSTLSYNSNVPVTSKLYYSYSVPIVDTVAQTASITDEQDSMIIDLATQCAVMEMMLM